MDCNSFFCYVEKVVTPGLCGKPVCVAGSNDGNTVALTPEAKAVGLHRGDPVFKVRDIINAYNVKVFSGNMMLYAAMSRRIVSILRKSPWPIHAWFKLIEIRGNAENMEIVNVYSDPEHENDENAKPKKKE